MPYDWNGRYIESKADNKTDILGFGEIGGVGQFIYHHIRFKKYETVDNQLPDCIVRPVINKKSPPETDPEDGMTGKEILTSLCELARQIDDENETRPCIELIIKWCLEHMHPYQIDLLYSAATDKSFDISAFEAELLARDAEFSIEDFMKDLGNLYNAARFYIAMDALCVLDNNVAYNMYKEGRYFEALSVFERYKHNAETPDIDISSAKGDLLAEMQLYNKYREEHPDDTPAGEFATEPYDDYEMLRDRLIECIPDFRLRIKHDPRTDRLVFSADVKSVFDIAWYTLARMLSEEPPLDEKGKPQERPEGIMVCCYHCGRFFIRNAKHQQYCDKPECQKARNAKNQRDFRRRKAMEKAKKQRSVEGK